MKNKGNFKGFTLLEIMVAMSILAVIMVLISQAVSLVSATWRSGIARADNFSQARAVLNLVNRDIQGMVLRPDLAAFVDENQKPSFAFYSQVSGDRPTNTTLPDRRLSLVQYSLSTTTPPLFQRKNIGLVYGTNAPNNLSLNQTNNLPDLPKLNSNEPQTLSEGIIDFRWQTIDGKADIESFFRSKDLVPGDHSKTRAIIISLLVLDANAFRLAQQSGTMLEDIRNKFTAKDPDVDQTYAQHWNTVLNEPGFGSEFPPQVRTGIRSFERYIPLPSTTTLE